MQSADLTGVRYYCVIQIQNAPVTPARLSSQIARIIELRRETDLSPVTRTRTRPFFSRLSIAPMSLPGGAINDARIGLGANLNTGIIKSAIVVDRQRSRLKFNGGNQSREIGPIGRSGEKRKWPNRRAVRRLKPNQSFANN